MLLEETQRIKGNSHVLPPEIFLQGLSIQSSEVALKLDTYDKMLSTLQNVYYSNSLFDPSPLPYKKRKQTDIQKLFSALSFRCIKNQGIVVLLRQSHLETLKKHPELLNLLSCHTLLDFAME